MDRRKFLSLLGSGALATMLVPAVATAFQNGELSQDELLDKINTNDGEGTLIQEAKIVGRVLGPSRHDGMSIALVVAKDQDPTFGADFEAALFAPTNFKGYVTPKTYKRGHVLVKDGATVTNTYKITKQKLYEREIGVHVYKGVGNWDNTTKTIPAIAYEGYQVKDV